MTTIILTTLLLTSTLASAQAGGAGSGVAQGSPYYITANGVNCRAGPSINYPVLRQYNYGQHVSLNCQAPGTNVGGDSIWDKTTDGCYVSDFYVYTGSDGYVVAHCPIQEVEADEDHAAAEDSRKADKRAAKSYPIKANGVNCRSGPGTSYAVKKQYNSGHLVTLTCQTPGTSVNGDTLWDKTSDGCYVSDWYVKTGTSNYVVAHCSAGGGSGGGSTSNTYCHNLNVAGVALIEKWEGFVASPGPDPVGYPTVGYGHKCQEKNCAEIHPRYQFPLTHATAHALLLDDIPTYTKCLSEALNGTPKLNANQWAALTSWTYNEGCGNVKTSTLVKRLNRGESPNLVAGQELPKWKLSNGKVFQGLINRRNDEIKLFRTPSSSPAYPKCG